MKRLIFIYFFMLSVVSYSQTITVVSTGDSTSNNVALNKVEIGFLGNASIGIDSFLSESSVDTSNTNIFSIQRKNSSEDCSYFTATQPIFFPSDLSINKDFRAVNGIDFFNLYFQIKNNSFLVKEIRVSDLTGNNLYETIDKIVVVRKCSSTGQETRELYKIEFFGFQYSYIAFNSAGDSKGTISSIIIKFRENLASVLSGNYFLENLNIQPNPTSHYLEINSTISITQAIVFDCIGHNLINQNEENIKRVDVNSLACGIYFISLTSRNGDKVCRKFIKN